MWNVSKNWYPGGMSLLMIKGATIIEYSYFLAINWVGWRSTTVKWILFFNSEQSVYMRHSSHRNISLHNYVYMICEIIMWMAPKFIVYMSASVFGWMVMFMLVSSSFFSPTYFQPKMYFLSFLKFLAMHCTHLK